MILTSRLAQWFGFVPVALADETTPGSGGITLTDPLGGQDFVQVIGKVAIALRTLAIPIVGVMVLYGAFQIMTAGGNPTKVSDGKKTIMYAVIGYAVILLSSEVVTIIQELLAS